MTNEHDGPKKVAKTPTECVVTPDVRGNAAPNNEWDVGAPGNLIKRAMGRPALLYQKVLTRDRTPGSGVIELRRARGWG